MRGAFAVLVAMSLVVPAQVSGHGFGLDADCAGGGIGLHAWHEIGHDLAAISVGETPLHPGALWGDKWSETQPHFQHIALGGLLMQIIVAAIEASEDRPDIQCMAAMNTIGSEAYALRAAISPTFGGDYEPFSPAGRNTITFASVGSALVFEALGQIPTLGPPLFGFTPVELAVLDHGRDLLTEGAPATAESEDHDVADGHDHDTAMASPRTSAILGHDAAH